MHLLQEHAPMAQQHHQDQDIDAILRQWPFQPGVISARLVKAHDGREVLQYRIEMGLLQMELTGRPDGHKPHGKETYLDWIRQQAAGTDKPLALTDQQRFEIDREFQQFYHRRICCLALRQFDRAVADADHTLAMMDFIAAHCTDQEWTTSHEQYRAFVSFHRTQAAAMAALERSGPNAAIEELDAGLAKLRQGLLAGEGDQQPEDDELISQLLELKASLRKEYELSPTLTEQLSEAVAAEEYERAARLRDEIARRDRKPAV
jgi:hypothetical protein